MATRRSTNTREARQEESRSSRKEKSGLVGIGGLWCGKDEMRDIQFEEGDYYKGAVGKRPDDNGVTDVDRLKELLDGLGENQSLNVLAFYNEKSEKDTKQPIFRLAVSVFTPGESGRRGGRRK